MNFFVLNSPKHSITRLALSIASGFSATGAAEIAAAADVGYNGGAGNLYQDPTGDQSIQTYNSLYVEGIYTGNTITVDGGTEGVQTQWNTDSTTPVAPYVIYGGVGVGAAGTTESDGKRGAELSNHRIGIENVSYDWSGQKTLDGIVAYGGGMGGGSVYGGLSICGAGLGDGTSSIGANGGAGGDVSGNDVILRNVTLLGAEGGMGGNTDGMGLYSSGVGGMGGGSVYGGLSIGGAGGTDTTTSTGRNGGFGGTVSSNIIELTSVTLNGASGGRDRQK